jgi:hypothetical protein
VIAEPQQPGPVCVLGEVWEVGRRGVDAEGQRCQTGGVDAEERRGGARSTAIDAETGPSDGRRRLAKPRQDEGVWGGRWQARRVMPQAGVAVRGRRSRRPQPPDSRPGCRGAANLRERPCDGDRPHAAWWGDLTDRWTEAGGGRCRGWWTGRRAQWGAGRCVIRWMGPWGRMPGTGRLAAGVRPRA